MADETINNAIKSFEKLVQSIKEIGEDAIEKCKTFDLYLKQGKDTYTDIYYFLDIKKNDKDDSIKEKWQNIQHYNQNLQSLKNSPKFGLLYTHIQKVITNINVENLIGQDFQEHYKDYIKSEIKTKLREYIEIAGSNVTEEFIKNIKDKIKKIYNYGEDDFLFSSTDISIVIDSLIPDLVKEFKITLDNQNKNYNQTQDDSNANRQYNDYSNNTKTRNTLNSNTSKKFAILIGSILFVIILIYFRKQSFNSNKRSVNKASYSAASSAIANTYKPLTHISKNNGNYNNAKNTPPVTSDNIKTNLTQQKPERSLVNSTPSNSVSYSSHNVSPKKNKVASVPIQIFKEEGFQSFKMSGCLYCHRIYNKGYTNGSNLSHIGANMSMEEIENQIVHPTNPSMPPNPNMPENEVAQIANWLESLK